MTGHATWAVVKREFLAFVRTKGFVIGTLFGPLILSLFLVLPVLFSRGGGSREVVIVDAAGDDLGRAVATALAPGEEGVGRYRVRVISPLPDGADSLRASLRRRALAEEIDGWLWLPSDLDAGATVRYEGRHATSFRDVRELRGAVGEAVRAERLRASGIDPEILADAMRPVELEARGLQAQEASQGTPDEIFFAAQFMAVALYLVILLYGNAILRGVREEKENRVVELVLSSVRPETLMAGKVFGVGAAGLLQVSVWVGFAALGLAFGEQIATAIGGSLPEVPSVPWRAGALFLLFFTGGYFLYASIYAALGAVATSGQEAQNLQYPAIVPLFVGFMMVFAVLDDPGSALATAGTLIPFTAPLVVPVRELVAPLPAWELALSVVLLAATCVLFVWLGGKVYKVTILASGQRPKLRKIWRWVRAA